MSTNAPSVGRQKGLTLVELIAFIVIVSIGLTGILAVMNQTVRSSADPMARKQALSFAEAVLEEVMAKDPVKTLPEVDFWVCANRRIYIGVRDYACFDGSPATAVIRGNDTLGATASAALSKLTATVSVATMTVSGVSMLRVTVSVSGGSEPIALTAYKADLTGY